MTVKTSPSFNDIAFDFDGLFNDVDHLTELEGEAHDTILSRYNVRTVLDCACGTGIQSIGLAQRGYQVSASDISPRMTEVLRTKAAQRRLAIEVKRADFRSLAPWRGQQFDAVISSGNSLTLMKTDRDITASLKSMLACTKPRGGVGVVGMHNYLKLQADGKKYEVRRAVLDARAPEFLVDLRFVGGKRTQVDYLILRRRENQWRLKTYTKSYRNLPVAELQARMLAAGYQSVELLDISGRWPYQDEEWVLAVGIT